MGGGYNNGHNHKVSPHTPGQFVLNRTQVGTAAGAGLGLGTGLGIGSGGGLLPVGGLSIDVHPLSNHLNKNAAIANTNSNTNSNSRQRKRVNSSPRSRSVRQ